ncbi:MAG: UDP-N-acetylmuramoyl-L-alanine--D-glutamate ligase [Acutalibacteraceae bacterium]|nr:UDP-N-acetylmuramoyl-L-alanine--D-glutamate ligase [Acutalibacteraceae bacterium]
MNREMFFKSVKGKKIAFCGIGKSNLPLIYKFIEKGAEVYACDRRDRSQLAPGQAEELESAGAKLILGDGYLNNLNVDIIFRTPGMNYFLPELTEARKKGIVVTSEMEVFFDLCPCKIFAVTGSDGKTTTTTLIATMLKEQGYNVHLGGNIGTPLLPIIEEIGENDIAVAELSSFQLISMRKSPDVSVVTNVAPNHLDVHKTMDEYIDAKKNIFMHQNAFTRTVLNADNEITASFADEVRGTLSYFSYNSPVSRGAYLDGDDICVADKNGVVKIMNKHEIRIPGEHNVENYLAAISAVWGYVDVETIVKVAREFGGVEHRIEFVREKDGVKYYNDSIATSPTRTIAGLKAFNQKLIVLAGGYDKHIPFDPLAPYAVEKIKVLILTGPTADAIEKAIRSDKNFDNCGMKILRSESLEQSVKMAHEIAKEGDIVSLSPACASFDAYPNFEERGNHYKKLVNEL